MVKLSCAGSIGLSFMGTRRATQIRHDCRSAGVGKEKREIGGGKESGGCNKEDGDRGVGDGRGWWWRHERWRQREGKK